MEGVERTNVVIARSQQQDARFPQRNLYTIDMDRKKNRNCYTYGGFRYLARNYRNRGMGMNRRIEVDQDSNNNLNEKEGLESPN